MSNQFDMDAAFREQQRAAMIESFRQSASLQAMVAMVVSSIKSDDPIVPQKIARQAKQLADALTNEVFSE